MAWMDLILLFSAYFYGMSCWYSFRLYKTSEKSLEVGTLRWLTAGAALQVIWFLTEWVSLGYAPMTRMDGILTALSLALALSLLGGRLRTFVPVLTSFFLPLILVLSVFSVFFGMNPVELMESNLMTPQMASHIFLTFLGFSCFTFGFGVGVAFWIQEGQLKNRQVKSWSYRLPALEDLDSLTAFYIGAGFLFWLGGLVLGGAEAFLVWHKLPLGDPKIVGSLLVLLIYAGFFLLRWGFKMRGRQTMVLVMAGYFLALFTFVGVRVFLTTAHTF